MRPRSLYVRSGKVASSVQWAVPMPPAFEESFNREVLQSERLIASIVVVVLGAILLRWLILGCSCQGRSTGGQPDARRRAYASHSPPKTADRSLAAPAISP